MFTIRRLVATALAVTLCFSAAPVTALADSYNDFDEITGHIDLKTSQKLAFTRPENGDFTTTAATYFLAGTSSPYSDMTLNGEVVQYRGSNGAWGVYVSLAMGENNFTIQQDGKVEQLTITRSNNVSVATTKVVSSMFPTSDVAYKSGETINLSCTAPAGSTVTAKVGNATIQMTQKVAAAQAGVHATFVGTVTAGSSDVTQSIGPVVYTLNGSSTYTSAGEIFVGQNLMVQVSDTSSIVFDRGSTNGNFVATARKGAVDQVVETNDTMYHLRMGGWIPKKSTQVLTQNVTANHTASDITMKQAEKGERFVLEDVGSPIASAAQNGSGLMVRFYNTKYNGSVSAANSTLFDEVEATQDGSDLVLNFTSASGEDLWGYLIEYENGNAVVYCKYKPTLNENSSKPLSGLTIVLDAGHGQIDSGAIGITGTDYAMEKDINLAVTQAVEKRLTGLGAKVVMTREDDSVNPDLNRRLQVTQDVDADLFIAFHCNSAGYGTDANRPSGTEVYYYEDISKTLATALTNNISQSTGRNNRGARYSYYKVTLNSYAPSVLVEQGFITNPWEYDNLCSKQNIYNTANAVAESIKQALK